MRRPRKELAFPVLPPVGSSGDGWGPGVRPPGATPPFVPSPGSRGGLPAAVPGEVVPLPGMRTATPMDLFLFGADVAGGKANPYKLLRSPWCLGADEAICGRFFAIDAEPVKLGPWEIPALEAGAFCLGGVSALCLAVGVGSLVVILGVAIYALIS